MRVGKKVIARRRVSVLAAATFLLAGSAVLAGPVALAEDERPRTVDAAVAALGSADPAARLAAVEDLAHLLRDRPTPGSVLLRLREALRRRGATERAALVRLLAGLEGEEARRLWLDRLDPEEDDRVLSAAVEAVAARAADPEVLRALIGTARDPRAAPARRALALEGLGLCTGDAPRLLLEVAREDWVEESGRALGLGRRGGEAVVPHLIEVLGHAHPAPRVHAWEGLVRITGRRLPADKAAWAAWWAGRAEEPAAPAAAPAPPPDRYEEPAPAHVPTYYGIPIPRARSRVVFCLDVSQSMWGDGIEQARRNLSRTIGELPTTYAFDVVCFHEDVMPWAGRLVAAHPVQKARAIAFLEGQKTVSYTNLYDAVEKAFSYAGRGRFPAPDPVRLDAVFLLSDGAPNRGRWHRDDDVVEGIADLSRKTVPVHTIGAGEEVFPLLRRIASATGGRFSDAFEHDG